MKLEPGEPVLSRATTRLSYLSSGDAKDPPRARIPGEITFLEGFAGLGVPTDIDQVMGRERTDNMVRIFCLKAFLVAPRF